MWFSFRTKRRTWIVQTVPNWRAWMWAQPGGWNDGPHNIETFWRLGPFYVQRLRARS